VTGGNKGIGFAICERLLGLSPLSDEGTQALNKILAENPVHVILAARDKKRGEEAVESLRKRGATNISFIQIDVTDVKSIQAAAEEVKRTYGKIFGLVNNAGMGWHGEAAEETIARVTFQTNYYGLKAMCDAFLPLLQEGGRVVTFPQ